MDTEKVVTFNDVMVDIETTGLSVDDNAVIQIAAVKFDLETRQVSSDTFDRCLRIPPKRYWDEGTREWWGKMPEVLTDIRSRMEDPLTVLRDFQGWAVKDSPDRRFWAKNAGFDYQFINSYCRQFGVEIPFHYRNVIDIMSYIRGVHNTTARVKIEQKNVGAAHNALFDCFTQIGELFEGCSVEITH